MSNAAVRTRGKAGRALAGRKLRAAPVSPAHGATVAFIVERLREDIWAGRLEPGSRLVESDLTARFAVSRGPVREGLRRLSADGLIEHRPHRGAVVRRLTEREIRELFLIRIEMEALAARLAAAADAPERRARFVASIEPIYSDSPRNPCNYLKENAAFHDAVMALADNLELRNLASPAAIAAHHGASRRRADAARARGLGSRASRDRRGDRGPRSGRRVGAHARTSRTGRGGGARRRAER